MRLSLYSFLMVAGAWPSTLWAQQHPATSPPPARQEHAAVPPDYHARYVAGTARLLQDLQRAVRYPAAALRAHVTGTVRVAFTVEPTGAVDDIRILSSPSPLLSEGVVQAVQALGPFLPARRHGQLVRDTVRCPLVFQITAPTGNLTARPTVQPLPAGPVQPHPADPARQVVMDKLVSFRDSIYTPATKTATVTLHTFTYDNLGQPATHTYTYWLNGRPIHSEQRRYTYRLDGQLAAEGNDQLRYVLGYSAAGQLRELTYSLRRPSGWQVVTHTQLQALAPTPAQPATLGVLIQTAGPDSLQLTYRLAYQLAPDHSLQQSQLYTHAHKTYAQPLTYTFTYDTAPNPFQGLFSEHWYQDQFEHQGPHNVVSKQQNGRPYLTKTYTYNAAGYPTRCVVAVRSLTPTQRVQQFAYAQVGVSLVPAEASAGSLTIYPNPATTTAALQVPGLASGSATVVVRQALTGQVVRQFTGQVANTRELTLSVADLPKGVYLVEVSQASQVATGRLQVE
jgi:TonB family protein